MLELDLKVCTVSWSWCKFFLFNCYKWPVECSREFKDLMTKYWKAFFSINLYWHFKSEWIPSKSEIKAAVNPETGLAKEVLRNCWNIIIWSVSNWKSYNNRERALKAKEKNKSELYRLSMVLFVFTFVFEVIFRVPLFILLCLGVTLFILFSYLSIFCVIFIGLCLFVLLRWLFSLGFIIVFGVSYLLAAIIGVVCIFLSGYVYFLMLVILSVFFPAVVVVTFLMVVIQFVCVLLVYLVINFWKMLTCSCLDNAIETA